MNKYRWFDLLWILLLGQFSCDQNRVFEEYKGMETESWQIQDSVSFTFSHDLPHGPVILGIKYNRDYEYHNLYVRYLLKDSLDGIVENQLLDVPLFDSKSGKPLGDGYGSTYTKYDTLPLKTDENYASISLIQYMRTDELRGIEAVGIKRIKE